MRKGIRILYLEDVPADVGLVNHHLRKAGMTVRTKHVSGRDEFLRELERRPPDLILSDHGLPEFDGFTALTLAREKCPEVPFIFVTDSRGEEMAIETFEAGATDYVLKNNLEGLAPAVRRALREAGERMAHRERERALIESEERFRVLIEGVKDHAFYMLDTEGRVNTWNTGAERVEGYTAAEIIGKPFATFFLPEDVEKKVPERALNRAKKTGRSVNEGWRVRKDGSRFWSQGSITALRDETGRLLGYVKIARDMTEQKSAQDEIERLNSELEQRVTERTAQLAAANEELEAFSRSVSHDLWAPVRQILGYVEILQSEGGVPPEGSNGRYLETIARCARQMGRLIDALLAFSRTASINMQYQLVDLAGLTAEAIQELRHETEGRQVEWQIEELPVVQGHPLMLRQAIVNLLSNALKYTRPRPKPKIEIGAKKTAREIILFVRDNGVGFDMAYGDKLFGVFHRLHSLADFEGSGVGLANVRRIIHRHGGRTWAEGKVNAGATFYFSLPRTPPTAQSPRRSPKE